MALLYEDLTNQIIKAFYEVYNELGYGFLERVYENALLTELQSMGLDCVQQSPIHVFYKNQSVGKYYADIIVDNTVVVELKALAKLQTQHEVQLINYLKATRLEIGLLLNFGERAEVKRKIYTNDRKKSG